MKIMIYFRNEDARKDLANDLKRHNIAYDCKMGYISFEIWRISSNNTLISFTLTNNMNVYVRTKDIDRYETI